MEPDPVARQLRARREAWGVTLAFVARSIGYGRSTVHAWETGDRHPSPTALRKWADALDCELLVVPRSELHRPARRAVISPLAGAQMADQRPARPATTGPRHGLSPGGGMKSVSSPEGMVA